MATTRDSSLLVNIIDLRRHVGERREVERTVHLPELRLADTVVTEGSNIDVDLVLDSVTGAIIATGTVRASWTSLCRRCLEPVTGTLDQEVDEQFAERPVEGESYPLGHDTIDLEPLVREAVLLSLPAAPLCREDCVGPDPEAFPVAVAAEDDEPAERPIDPRWAALDALRELDPSPDQEAAEHQDG